VAVAWCLGGDDVGISKNGQGTSARMGERENGKRHGAKMRRSKEKRRGKTQVEEFKKNTNASMPPQQKKNVDEILLNYDAAINKLSDLELHF